VIRLQIIASGSGDGVWGRENNQGLLPTSVVLSGWGLTSAHVGHLPVLFRGQTTGTAVEVITRREPIPSLGRGGWLPDMQSCFAYSARGGHGGKLDEVPRCCERRRHAACFSSWPVSGRGRENATCRCRHGARSGPSRRSRRVATAVASTILYRFSLTCGRHRPARPGSIQTASRRTG
jgi:hypothetical protein